MSVESIKIPPENLATVKKEFKSKIRNQLNDIPIQPSYHFATNKPMKVNIP